MSQRFITTHPAQPDPMPPDVQDVDKGGAVGPNWKGLTSVRPSLSPP